MYCCEDTDIGQSLAYRVLRGWNGRHVPMSHEGLSLFAVVITVIIITITGAIGTQTWGAFRRLLSHFSMSSPLAVFRSLPASSGNQSRKGSQGPFGPTPLDFKVQEKGLSGPQPND